MEIDFLLPISVFIIIAFSILFYEKIHEKMRTILEGRKLSMREIVFMVIFMGMMITMVALMPSYTIQILFVAAYSYILLVLTYIVLGKLFPALFPPAIFILTYLLIRDFFVMNIFAALFAIMVITYLNSLFSWKITMVFAILLTVIDVTQVFLTGHIVEAANKMIDLRLPVALILLTYPSYRFTALGLGDIFLSGLLSTQTALRYGRKKGLITAATISIALFIFEILMLNWEFGAKGFPATVVVLLGWLLSMFFKKLWKD